MKTLYVSLILLFAQSRVSAQTNVDQAGACGGNTPCYTTIQAAVDAAAAGQTINVYPGNYVENVLITKSLTLRSVSGPGSTTITGIGPNSYAAPVMVQGPVSDVTIGGTSGHGFTIIGTDNNAAGVESSAIQLGGPGFAAMNNINIGYNTITPQGEAGILSYYSSTVYITGLNIFNNTFNGKTFTGATPATGTLFSDINTAKSAIAINLGAGNTTITKNIFTTTTGAGTLGNYMVQVNSVGSSITLNDLAGATGGTSAGMYVRGSGADVSCNRIDLTNRGTAAFSGFLQTSSPAAYTVAAAATANTFLPAGYIVGNDVLTLAASTAANAAYPAPGCSVVPLRFLNVSATRENAGTVNVRWQTSNETGNAGFTVQQSTDGSFFTDETTVSSYGSGSFVYTANIPAKNAAMLYFRIKQTDVDGRSSLSQIVSVKSGSEGGIRLGQNPVTDNIVVKGLSGKTTLMLYDAAGKLARTQTTSNTVENIKVTGLTPGSYTLKVANAESVTSLKVSIR